MLLPFYSLFSFNNGVDTVYPGQPGARYWTEDPWNNGPMVGYGADTKHFAGIPVDTKAVQPQLGKNTIGRSDYGVAMIGAFAPVNTYTYEPNWSPNAI